MVTLRSTHMVTVKSTQGYCAKYQGLLREVSRVTVRSTQVHCEKYQSY